MPVSSGARNRYINVDQAVIFLTVFFKKYSAAIKTVGFRMFAAKMPVLYNSGRQAGVAARASWRQD